MTKEQANLSTEDFGLAKKTAVSLSVRVSISERHLRWM